MNDDASGGTGERGRGRWWLLARLSLLAPPLLTFLSLRLAMVIDGLYLGSPWQIIVVYLVGPGALTCGLLGAVLSARLVLPDSRLGRVAVISVEMVVSVAVWGAAFPVKGWK